jgi:hypothetical protein
MKVIRHLCLMVLACLLTAVTIAQDDQPADGTVEVAFRADRTTPLVGEQVQLSLIVSLPPNFELIEWPKLPEEWGPFAVYDAGEIETNTGADGSQIVSQDWIIRLWRPDDYETPKTFIGYRTPNSEDVQRLPAQSAFFTVESILDSGDLNLRPARPPIRFIYLPPWAVAMIAIAVAAAGYKGWERYQLYRERHPLEPVVELSPAQLADHELASASTLSSQYEQVGVVSDALRQFVDAHFHTDILSQTTEEIKNDGAALRGSLTAKQWQAFINILTTLDLLRFAPAPIDGRMIERSIKEARRWVAAVDLDSRGRAA